MEELEQEAQDYCVTVHLFGAVLSPACTNYGTEEADTLRRNLDGVLTTATNVNDVLKTATTEVETVKLAKDVKAVEMKELT